MQRIGIILLASVFGVAGGVARGEARDPRGEKTESVKIQRGDLSVHFQVGSKSPGVLSGVQSLFNVKAAGGARRRERE